MLKLVAIALVLATCDCQVFIPAGLGNLGYGGLGYGGLGLGGIGLGSGLVQPHGYILVGTPTAQPAHLTLPSYLTRQAYSLPESPIAFPPPLIQPRLLSAPATRIVQAPAPTIIQAPAPRIYAAPPPQIIAAPAPPPVILQAPAPLVLPAPRPVIQTVVEPTGPSEPYNFGFQSTDEEGNQLARSEVSDGAGTVTGSYSYLDAKGLKRIVNYVADAGGFRADVNTNEPGTANADPADVKMNVEEVPANVQAIVAQYSVPKVIRV